MGIAEARTKLNLIAKREAEAEPKPHVFGEGIDVDPETADDSTPLLVPNADEDDEDDEDLDDLDEDDDDEWDEDDIVGLARDCEI
jgi:hypothetical protein